MSGMQVITDVSKTDRNRAEHAVAMTTTAAVGGTGSFMDLELLSYDRKEAANVRV